MRFKFYIFIFLALIVIADGVHALEKALASGENDKNGVNLALGKPYTLDPAPNYKLCLDADDSRQLTDGMIYSGGKMLWIEKTTVGWERVPQALITVDLGRVEPLEKAIFRTAFDGPRNVRWPRSVRVFVSEDGKEYSDFGDMVDPLWDDELPPELAPFGEKQKHVFHRYGIPLNTRGRYVCFVARSSRYIFCDEIEVLRGNAVLLERPLEGKRVGDVRSHLEKSVVRENVSRVLLRDMERIRRGAADLTGEERAGLEGKLARLKEWTEAMEFQCLADATRAVTPLNDIHRDILKVHAEVLRLKKYPPLMAWHKNRWDPLDALETPVDPCAEGPKLVVEMMDREYRAEVVNLTNASEDDLTVEVSFEGLPGGRVPRYITVYQVEFVGTQQGKMIADPLVEADKKIKCWQVKIPSGMTRQLWLSFNPRGIKDGRYEGVLWARVGGRILLKVPLDFVLHPFQFPDRPRLSLAMFDYTDRPYGFKSITERNVSLAVSDMREHFVDTAYGHRSSACWPEKEDFDAEGNLTKPLRTEGFDDWVRRWKDARRFHIYTGNALKDFCGEPMGTPRFNRMVGQWMSAFAKHARTRGIKPERMAMHLYDEPLANFASKEACLMNAVWGKAMKAGAPEILLFTTATLLKEPSEEEREMMSVHDIICLHLPESGGVNKLTRDVVLSGKNKDGKFWLYSSFGPSHLFDPCYYHRLQAWHCWRDGAVGMAFWNYWNSYKDGKCAAWNEFAAQEESYGVTYTTADSVTGSKHWEGIREGVEDYEYLNMLSARIEELGRKGESSERLRSAERLLATLPSEVARPYEKNSMSWFSDKNREAADQARIRILRALASLCEGEK
ncbi:MAG: hypothetical protein PHV34_01090 [Verrucomicrobiae bacterium]|nr:hypothetical protein [Verrucomicrobiae bacterium]